MRRCCVLILIILLLFVNVAWAQTVKLTRDTKFYRTSSTSSPSVEIVKGVEVNVTAVQNGWARVEYLGKTGYMQTDGAQTTEISTSWKDKVIIANWFENGNHILKRHHYGYVYDIKTGTRIKVYRKGGVNHADLEPATYEDGVKMKKLGASWDARPAILYADGQFAACSINTMGHGDQTITDNGFEGQFCLHMIGSKTHENAHVREDHQRAAKKAYQWAHQ